MLSPDVLNLINAELNRLHTFLLIPNTMDKDVKAKMLVYLDQLYTLAFTTSTVVLPQPNWISGPTQPQPIPWPTELAYTHNITQPYQSYAQAVQNRVEGR